MIRRPYMKPCNPTQLVAELQEAGLTLSEEGGSGRFYGAERFGVHVVVYLADNVTFSEETTVQEVVGAHIPQPLEEG